MQSANLFVKFAEKAKMPDGFKSSIDYPVFAIDRVQDGDDNLVTEFLLANGSNQFVWIEAGLLRRVPLGKQRFGTPANRPVARPARVQ